MHYLQTQVNDQLDDMVDGGIIEQVLELSDWCHLIVIVQLIVKLVRNV